LAEIQSSKSWDASGATIRKAADDWPSSRALASASSPSPTMTTTSPSTFMKTGKAFSLGKSCGIAVKPCTGWYF
jgi:hypothetical protein